MHFKYFMQNHRKIKLYKTIQNHFLGFSNFYYKPNIYNFGNHLSIDSNSLPNNYIVFINEIKKLCFDNLLKNFV